jgi:large subunit ribosomal protein L17
MRHRKKVNHLGRQAAHRKALMSNLASSLILHKRINTTLAKAKALRIYVEPLITKSKEDSTHSRRVVFSYLQDKNAVSELFREVAQKVADRPGGYTRILKTGFRKGDGAEMCFIELVDYNTNMLKGAEDTQQKKTRRGRRGGKKETAAAETKAPKAEKETKEEQTAAAPEAPQAEEPKAEAETPAAEEPKAESAPADEPKAETKSEKSAEGQDEAEKSEEDSKK